MSTKAVSAMRLSMSARHRLPNASGPSSWARAAYCWKCPSNTAKASSNRVGKCRWSTPWPTPASRAIALRGTSKPRAAKSRFAASRRAARFSAATAGPRLLRRGEGDISKVYPDNSVRMSGRWIVAGFDQEFDVVIVGSGAAALAAALGAVDEGLSALMIESGEKWGGNSNKSGGGMWLPNNPLMREDGAGDSREE